MAAAGGVLLLAALLIGWAVARGWTAGVDRAGLHAMASGSPGFWLLWTRAGDTVSRIIVALIVVGALLLRRRWLAGAALFLTVGGAIALNEAAKAVAGRARPDLLPHLDSVQSLSFPSGHASGAMALALGLAFLPPSAWRGRAVAAALLYALLVGLSRVALAVHWPSDILAGWCLGAGWALIVQATATRLGRSIR